MGEETALPRPAREPTLLQSMQVMLQGSRSFPATHVADYGIPSYFLMREVDTVIRTFFTPDKDTPDDRRPAAVGFLDPDGNVLDDVSRCNLRMSYEHNANNPADSAVVFTFTESLASTQQVEDTPPREVRHVRLTRRQAEEIVEDYRKFVLNIQNVTEEQEDGIHAQKKVIREAETEFDEWVPQPDDDQELREVWFDNLLSEIGYANKEIDKARGFITSIELTRRGKHHEGTDKMSAIFRQQGIALTDMRLAAGLHSLCTILLASPKEVMDLMGYRPGQGDQLEMTRPMLARAPMGNVRVSADGPQLPR